MLVYSVNLPDPVAAQVERYDGVVVEFKIRDAVQKRRLQELLARAVQDGYAVELSLVHYEGAPNMPRQAEARKQRKAAG